MRQWMIDAFASEPFKGNPACVVEPFDAWPDAAWMQALAQENNQAETAFLLKTADPARFGLRWCTPAVEVPLCGHATLAAAHVLFAELGLQAPRVSFDTRSGVLGVSRTEGGYEMDFPADPPRRIADVDGLAGAIGGIAPLEVWSASYLVAVLASEADVRRVKADTEVSPGVPGARRGFGVRAQGRARAVARAGGDGARRSVEGLTGRGPPGPNA